MHTSSNNQHLEFGRQLRQPSGNAGINVGNLMNESNKVMYQDVFRLLTPKPENKLLEIGFGNGKFFNDYFALEPNLAVTGLDFSETMFTEAFKNNQDLIAENKLTLVHGNSDNMPFANDEFDFVIAVNTVYFWPSAHDQLLEIKRVLKNGGALLLGYRPKNAVKDAPFTKEVFTLYEPEEINQLLVNAGFTIEKETDNFISVKTSEGKEIQMQGKAVMAKKPGITD